MRLVPAFLFILSAAFTFQAMAGAWTQKAGEGLLINSSSYYATSAFYDALGNKKSQNRFSKYELSPYLEYGITDAITLGGNLSLQQVHQLGPREEIRWGLGDSEFFLRTRLWQANGFVLALEPMVKLPTPYRSPTSLQLGGEDPDAGLGISAGYGFEAYGLNHFINIDSQYRYRFGLPENQLKFSLSAGVGLSDRWMLLPQVFATYRTKDPKVTRFSQSSGDDYQLLKLQLSAVYMVNENVSLQVGGYSHASGKNVGAGNGLLIALWKKF